MWTASRSGHRERCLSLVGLLAVSPLDQAQLPCLGRPAQLWIDFLNVSRFSSSGTGKYPRCCLFAGADTLHGEFLHTAARFGFAGVDIAFGIDRQVMDPCVELP
jgi:hypothetical protein